MNIQARSKDGWVDIVNHQAHFCDTCKLKLWIAPSNQLYCNNKHTIFYKIDGVLDADGEQLSFMDEIVETITEEEDGEMHTTHRMRNIPKECEAHASSGQLWINDYEVIK